MAVIEADDLKRTYRTSTGTFRRRGLEVEAVRGITFSVPNGARKTTNCIILRFFGVREQAARDARNRVIRPRRARTPRRREGARAVARVRGGPRPRPLVPGLRGGSRRPARLLRARAARRRRLRRAPPDRRRDVRDEASVRERDGTRQWTGTQARGSGHRGSAGARLPADAPRHAADDDGRAVALREARLRRGRAVPLQPRARHDLPRARRSRERRAAASGRRPRCTPCR